MIIYLLNICKQIADRYEYFRGLTLVLMPKSIFPWTHTQVYFVEPFSTKLNQILPMEWFFVSYFSVFTSALSPHLFKNPIFLSANFLPFRVFVASEGNQNTNPNKPIGFSLKYFQIGCGDHNTNAEGDGASAGNN